MIVALLLAVNSTAVAHPPWRRGAFRAVRWRAPALISYRCGVPTNMIANRLLGKVRRFDSATNMHTCGERVLASAVPIRESGGLPELQSCMALT
jgi:hypothetical protein